MRINKILAITMAVTLVVGSSLTAFAADANGATGEGTNTGHLDTDVFTAVLPTDTAIADFFDFTIDPENILAKADKFTDNTTAAGAAFANTDLVYFKQASGAEKAYASTSQAANVGAKNYVDVDVKVQATVADAEEGETVIPLVATDEELTAATTPSLLLQLKVGEDQTVAITSEGASATETIEGQTDNYDTVYDSTNNLYKLQEKSSVTWANNTTPIKLAGKVKGGIVESTLLAPTVTLTWTVTKHQDSYLSATTMSASSNEVTVTLPDGVTLTGVKLTLADGTGAINLTNQYTYADSKLSVPAATITAWLGLEDPYNKLVVSFSDETTETITLQ